MSRIRADRLTNKEGTGAPLFPNGIRVVGLTSLSNVIAGVTTFTSDVSIGGTLTYEDVTNIDSVGMVTARTGIKVLAGGINAVGVITATSFSGSGANLTGIDATSLKDGSGNIIAQATSTGIGIGTNIPATTLHVYKDGATVALIESIGANDSRVRIKAPSDRISYLEFADDDADAGEIRYDHSSNYMGFHVNNNVERLRIGSAGQIGIAGANYGTSGQVITSQGASAAPQWATPAGGAWSVLTSQDITTSYGQTYWESKGWDVTNYTAYRYIFNQVAVSGGNFDLDIRFYYQPYSNGSASGSESLQTGGSDYNYRYDRRRLNGSGSADSERQEDRWRLGGTDSAETWNIDHTVALSPPTYTNIKSVSGRTFYYKSGALWRIEDDCCMFWHQEGYISGVRVYGSSGNLQHGRFQVLRMSKT